MPSDFQKFWVAHNNQNKEIRLKPIKRKIKKMARPRDQMESVSPKA